MSFSAETKTELCELPLGETCCVTAECYGMLLFAREFGERRIRVVTESEAVVKRLRELCRALFSIAPKAVQSKGHGAGKYEVNVSDDDAERIFSFFGHDETQVSTRINYDIVLPQCCRRSFLRGAYLTGGSVTDPNSGYHLEISTPLFNLSNDAAEIMTSLGLSPKRTVRGGKNVVYFKSSEEIEDFLNNIGAGSSAFRLMEVKVMKDVRNRANRLSNCDSFNISRSINAGVEQAEKIRKTLETKGRSHFPQELRELAQIRVDNPEASLRELGEMLEKPLSKSGVSHKLRRIMEYTE
ncbi:MAG: DNA-binding protein WhiA [Clostridia bacterium]|nr:DNA-binding protein WhiA [Clostridia bacterium]